MNKFLTTAYVKQKSMAKTRDINWKFTEEEWLRKWNESGKLHLRGRCKGCYVMARYGDTGPYSFTNTKIILHSDNLREGTNVTHGRYNDKQTTVKGITYSSRAEAARQQDVSMTTILRWVRSDT